MPFDIQKKMVRSISGLEHAEIMRYAYAIEYDCIDPTCLFPTLESKLVRGLFFAGQVNGTSGYEEAAAQGIVAGINAARQIKNQKKIVFDRTNSYIGVLIDDLVTKGTNEPYRMMTSRAEHRLWLRQDNADFRLTPLGAEVGLAENRRIIALKEKTEKCARFEKVLKETRFLVGRELDDFLKKGGQPLSKKSLSAFELLLRGFSLAEIENTFGKFDFPFPVKNHVAIEIKYKGYIDQQKQVIEKQKKLENTPISLDFDFSKIKGLRVEAVERLCAVRPLSVGQASRISGVNPADITVLLLHLRK